jgi:hypothetical protein
MDHTRRNWRHSAQRSCEATSTIRRRCRAPSTAHGAPTRCEIFTKIVRHPVGHAQVPIDQIRKFSEDLALTLVWFDAVGYDADIAGNAKEFGIRPTSFANWAREHFKQPVGRRPSAPRVSRAGWGPTPRACGAPPNRRAPSS